MRIALFLTCIAVLWSSSSGAEEVYKNKDSQGNVTFSDVPTTGSKAVDISETNTAESVDIPPPAPAGSETAATASTASAGRTGPVVTGGDKDLVDAKVVNKKHEELSEGEDAPGPDSQNPGKVKPEMAPQSVNPRPSPGPR